MRAVIQRVSRASVSVNMKIKSKIEVGLLILLGIEEHDDDNDIEWLCNKLVNLRIFNDSNDVMNLSVLDVGGNILVIKNKKRKQTFIHTGRKSGCSYPSV